MLKHRPSLTTTLTAKLMNWWDVAQETALMCRSELASKDVMLADAREFWVEKTETLLIRGRTNPT